MNLMILALGGAGFIILVAFVSVAAQKKPTADIDVFKYGSEEGIKPFFMFGVKLENTCFFKGGILYIVFLVVLSFYFFFGGGWSGDILSVPKRPVVLNGILF